MIRSLIACLSLLLVLSPAGTAAQGLLEQQVITALPRGEGGPNRLYGAVVAIDADLAVAAESIRGGRLFGFRKTAGAWQRAPELDLHDPLWQVAAVALSDGNLVVRAVMGGNNREVRIYRARPDGWQFGRTAFSSQSSFGSGVAVSGSIAAFGAPGAPGDLGQVFTFRGNGDGTWDFLAILRPSTNAAAERFGESVAIVAGAVVVGAPGEDLSLAGDGGAAYVFELTGSTWTQVARLTAPAPAPDAEFGRAVAISGLDEAVPDRLLVGAAGSSIPGQSDTGQVYAFRRSGGVWSYSFAIEAPVLESNSRFGERLALDGRHAVIGAPLLDGNGGTQTGAVWGAQFSTAFNSVTLTRRDDPQQESNAQFGNAVAIDRDGPTTLVGAPRASPNGASSGAVSMGLGSTAVPFPAMARALSLGRGQDAARFGAAISSHGDAMWVGAPDEAFGPLERSGAVYLFRRAAGGSWVQEARLQSPMAEANENFGEAVAVHGDLALVGAPGADLAGIDSGAVYVYRRSNGVWAIENQLLSQCPSTQRRAFGRKLAFDGTRALIGALCPPATSGGPTSDIGVFIGTRQPDGAWTFGLAEAASRMSSGGWDDGLAVIGTHNSNGSVDGVQDGHVRTFAWNGAAWQFVGTSYNGTNQPTPQGHGLSLGVDQGLLAIASHRANTPVVVRRRSGDLFLPEASLLPDGISTTETLRSTAVGGGRVAIGAALMDVTLPDEGAVFVFERNQGTWSQTQRLVSGQPETSAGFGDVLAFTTDGALLIAAPAASRRFRNEGVVHVWAAPPDLAFADGFE